MRCAPLLTFNGNCRQAMHFYQQCLGGELVFQSIADTPQGQCFPSDMQQVVLFSKLQNGELILIGTDLTDEAEYISQGKVSIVLWLQDAAELTATLKRLSKYGQITHPLSRGANHTITASVTDQFSVQWVLRLRPGG